MSLYAHIPTSHRLCDELCDESRAQLGVATTWFMRNSDLVARDAIMNRFAGLTAVRIAVIEQLRSKKRGLNG